VLPVAAPATPPNAADPKFADAEKKFEDAVAALKSPADAANLPFFTKAQLATAAAWSPDRRIRRSISIWR